MNIHKSIKIFKISILCIFILTITTYKAFSQLFDASQNPPSVKFSQINTPQFQIIYPTPFSQEAQRMANVLDAIIADVSKSLGHLPKPISILLQTQGVISNGFVQMAPRRSEFYTIPAQEFDSQDWLNSLAVHELRHVVQFDKLAPKLNAPLFEELKLALFGINLPPWYFEGDAVGIETALTQSGRGRQPSFELVLRANELSGNHYSYSKNYLGSLKSYTPGYYPLGYFMTTKMRRDFGPSILDQVLNRIKRFPIRPYNFSSSLKKYGGIGTHQLYKNTMQEMDSLWQNQLKQIHHTNYLALQNIDGKIPSSYLLPYFTNDGKIICFKSSKAQTPTITIINNKSEQKLLKIGSQTEPNLNYAANKLIWDEYRADPRFGQRSYNVICFYDLTSKTYKQLTHQSRLFSPALSLDGRKIIAVKVTTENIFNLVEIDTETGKEIKSYPNPKNFTLQTPRFDKSGNQIVVTAVNEQGKTILWYHENAIEQLMPQQKEIISRPSFYKNQVVFKAHYNGIDNIYAVDLQTKKITQITNAQFGAYYPSVDEENGLLIFNDYQPQGYNIASLNLKDTQNFHDFIAPNTFVKYYEPLIKQENSNNVFENIPQKTYESKPYRDFSHLFYFHSIMPVVESNLNNYNFGFDFVSNNKLNTLATSFGYRFNNGLKKSDYLASFVYQKFYPQFSLNYENTANLAYAEVTNGQIKTIVPFQWRQNYTSLKIEIPFFANWLNKSFSSSIDVESSYTNRYQLSLKPTNFSTSINFPLKYQLFAGLNSQTSARDLAPKWGQNFRLSFEHLPFEHQLSGNNLVFKSLFYFPGLFLNHSLQITYNWQKNSGVYNFNIDIPRASGYANLSSIQNLNNSFLIDYRFPIAYPDLEIGPLAYIKRIRGGFFTDFENLGDGNGLRSYGAELRADMNLLRFYLPNFDFGGKFILPNDGTTKKPIFELSLYFNY